MENLKALVYKGDLTPYQIALAQREFEGLIERLELFEKAVKNNAVLPLVSERTLGINSCAALIKSMPTDQAIQIMKSDITGQPQTTVIDGELVVVYVR